MSAANMFGFTNDVEDLNAAIAWKDSAIADGWVAEPLFGNESIESATRLLKDGYIAQVIARVANHKYKYEAKVSVWGDDGLAIAAPRVYDHDSVFSGTTRCNYCKKGNVKTQRVGFAGRCCDDCLPEVKKKVERPGWTL